VLVFYPALGVIYRAQSIKSSYLHKIQTLDVGIYKNKQILENNLLHS